MHGKSKSGVLYANEKHCVQVESEDRKPCAGGGGWGKQEQRQQLQTSAEIRDPSTEKLVEFFWKMHKCKPLNSVVYEVPNSLYKGNQMRNAGMKHKKERKGEKGKGFPKIHV